MAPDIDGVPLKRAGARTDKVLPDLVPADPQRPGSARCLASHAPRKVAALETLVCKSKGLIVKRLLAVDCLLNMQTNL